MKQIGIFLLLWLLCACAVPVAMEYTAPQLNLNDLQPLPTPKGHEIVPLRVAIAAVISPQGTLESYESLLQYFEDTLGRPVELVQRRTYLEMNDLVEKGKVDLAFVCTSAYVVGQQDFGMELLVAPQVAGETTYHSYLIVPNDSAAQNISDLAGKVFAFTDPISLTGRVYPTYLLQQLGTTPEAFFSRVFFTYSHDEAIYAVANGLADGASVDSLVYDYALTRDPSLTQKVKVIHQSPAFGIPPVVVNPNLRPQVKAELQAILLEMNRTPEGQASLKQIGVERFVAVQDEIYRAARALLKDTLVIQQP